MREDSQQRKNEESLRNYASSTTKDSINVEIIKNKAHAVELEAELMRVNKYLGKIDEVLNDEKPKTLNQIRADVGMKPIVKNCKTCGWPHKNDNCFKTNHNNMTCWSSDIFTADTPDPKNQEEFKNTGTIGERKCIDCYHRSSSGVCIEGCINKDKWLLNNSVKTTSVLQDSGERTDFGTGAVRDMHEGKGRCDLLPPRALLRLARHFENGAKKYGERNWELGIPCHSFADSAHRHYLRYMNGETDEDHLMAAIWNLMCLAETEEKRPEMMDIPSRMKKDRIRGVDFDGDCDGKTAMDLLHKLSDVKFCESLNHLKQVDRPTVTVELIDEDISLINSYKAGDFEEALRRLDETREEINRMKDLYK